MTGIKAGLNKLPESVTGFIVGGYYTDANGDMFITLDISCGEDTRHLHLRLIGTETIIEDVQKFILDSGLAVAFIGEWENEDKHTMNVHKLLLGKTPCYTNSKLKCQVTDTVLNGINDIIKNNG